MTAAFRGFLLSLNGDLPRDPCEWCQHSEHTTQFRVYGRPREDVFDPVRCEDCCKHCVPHLARTAREECRDDGDIQIEYRVDPRDTKLAADFERIFG